MICHFTEISVNARYSELPGLLAATARAAVDLGATDDDAKRLQLVIEELFTNTIGHGHGGDSDHCVHLAVGRNGQALAVRYADEAPPFDFLEFGQKKAPTVALGGMGIPLIRGLCKTLRYAWRDGRNVTEIEF
jgi:serine/threonine-protein kinase RsbW